MRLYPGKGWRVSWAEDEEVKAYQAALGNDEPVRLDEMFQWWLRPMPPKPEPPAWDPSHREIL